MDCRVYPPSVNLNLEPMESFIYISVFTLLLVGGTLAVIFLLHIISHALRKYEENMKKEKEYKPKDKGDDPYA